MVNRWTTCQSGNNIPGAGFFQNFRPVHPCDQRLGGAVDDIKPSGFRAVDTTPNLAAGSARTNGLLSFQAIGRALAYDARDPIQW